MRARARARGGQAALTAAARQLTVKGGDTVTIQLFGADPQNFALTYSLLDGVQYGSLSGSGHVRSYTAQPTYFDRVDTLSYLTNNGRAPPPPRGPGRR